VHNQLRRIAVRIATGAMPSTTRRVFGVGSTAASAGEGGATEHSGRWTCTYRDHNGVRASADFSSAPQALDFAEQHARLMGVRRGEWTRQGDIWHLVTPVGTYLVREQSLEQTRPEQRQ
jgi:hypothetical protein